MSAFTIESIDLHPSRGFPEDAPPLGVPRDAVRTIVRGRMADGRVFYNETWLTKEFIDHVGEDRARQIVRESARPPEEKAG